MHAALILLEDALAGDRCEYALRPGALLGAELMRLFPGGLEGAWRLYAGEVDEALEIAPETAVDWPVRANDRVLLVRLPGTPDFWINLAVAAILSFAAYALTPKPRTRARFGSAEEQESGNNQLAAQTNVLRPGARVPEIMGRVRCFPDLLTNPVEVWTRTVQELDQFFVIGCGDYDLSEFKFGDTAWSAITGSSVAPYHPGELVPVPTFGPMKCVKASATLSGVSLVSEDGSIIPPVSGVSFAAAAKTMTAPAALALTIDAPITIDGTLSNDGVRFVLGLSGALPPFVYQLNGPVADEASTNPAIAQWIGSLHQGYSNCQIAGPDITFTTYFTGAYTPADAVRVIYAGVTYYGTIHAVAILASDPYGQTLRIEIRDLYGVPLAMPTGVNVSCSISNWKPPAGGGGGGGGGGGVDTAAPTDWYVVPLSAPDEVWLDFAFPRGLAKYHDGARQLYEIEIRADFRRGAAGAVVSRTFTYEESTAVPLRWTEKIVIASLGLAGSDPLEVRCQRETAITPDSASDQYLGEARWQELRGVKSLAPRAYPLVTIVQVHLSNNRSASSLGELAFNAIAERRLPTWSGSAWSAPAATRKWADNFVARCKALDGANRPLDADLDLAGIYALQAQLDALDGGAQGQISLTLDQQQDIDSELAQIADVVRAVVYRVGRKIYVSRDQANATPIALFNGRAKSAEGEAVSVRMKSEDENDAVMVQWVDELAGWKQRECQYPEILAANVQRVATQCANWPQAWRRALFEWNRVKYRREQIVVSVTADGRICRPGDVVHITDDIGNLAIAAGEVLFISGLVLTLDHDLDFSAGGTFTILLRDEQGVNVDAVPCTAVTGEPNQVQLARAPSVTIKGRDEALGTLYSFYSDSNVTARQWLLSGVEASEWVQLSGFNYSALVYAGDAMVLPARPPIEGT